MCVLFVKVHLVLRDRGRSLTAAVVHLALGDVTCVGSVGSVGTSAMKRVKTLVLSSGFGKCCLTQIICTVNERFQTNNCTIQ